MFVINGVIKLWDPSEDNITGGPSSITVRMEYLFAFQIWYCELCLENIWGGGGKHWFVNFCSLSVPRRWVRGCGVGQKVLFRASWNRIFFQPRFKPKQQAWQILACCITGYFCFFTVIAFSSFLSLEIYKNLGPPLSSITRTVNCHADFFYKYIDIDISINRFICFKHYTVWDKFF